MSVVAYRDGILAADRQCSDAGDMKVGLRTKIFRAHGNLHGCVGNAGVSEAYRAAIEDSTEMPPPTDDKDWGCLRIQANGTVYRVSGNFFAVKVEAPYHAIGSGDMVAMGAFYMGATAEGAVQAACEFIYGCGGGVDVLRLNETTPVEPHVSSTI